ncbi:predicted protein [Uncinocarpus reesii 1704]|uniref:Mediator of RNA polymerase II transcription subunit 14 n=1 Tax=Uncinocarpus reesii (strain UAMH 1704) TaxID=336963 RepID=C4JT84_UNCRE|nr:uncharacterized protein UREG_05673 [Uncinocarpus reesii 1704]EEP80831.1 predicted protein [Uncinocarpus reesii 1704]
MPGLAMDGSGAVLPGTGVADAHCGPSRISCQPNGRVSLNGDGDPSISFMEQFPRLSDGHQASLDDLPPELAHITLGFFPFARLISRVVQQSWNDLNELVNDIGSSPPSQVDVVARLGSANPLSGKYRGEQHTENALNKIRLLEFAHTKRVEFIKLLVLSQWSRQANEVSRLIDIQAFIRMRYSLYGMVLHRIGNMKQDLVGAQLANPDLGTALHILSNEGNETIPAFGFLSPKPLGPRRMLNVLRRINKLISMRLTTCDNIPSAFKNHSIQDGRVTLIVPGEFEIDLSVAFETNSAQFFFVDMRFLFFPSSCPNGELQRILDQKVNAALMNFGLIGCFNLMHNLTLTHKITILFKQAADLTRTFWADHLRVELLHRTLIIQYWTKKPGKSWIEIGIRSGTKRPTEGAGTDTSFLHLRWVRDNEEVDATEIDFNLTQLSAESILFSVVSLHITHILRITFERLHQKALYSLGALYLGMGASSMEPGDCHLEVQFTQTRRMNMVVEPVSGDITLRIGPSPITRYDPEIIFDKNPVENVVERISRLRCAVALEEVESHAKAVGWISLNLRHISPDNLQRVFPSIALRRLYNTPFSSFANALSGMIVVRSNLEFLSEFTTIRFFPSTKGLVLQPYLRVPNIYIHLSTTFPTEKHKRSFLDERLRISYRGIDQQSGHAMTVVHGRFTTTVDDFGALFARPNKGFSFQTNGSGFTMVFSTPIGLPIITRLLDRLHQIDNMVFAVELLKSKGFKIFLLSPLRISFAYPSRKEFRGSIRYSYEEKSSQTRSESCVIPVSDPSSITHPRIDIGFNHQNPHRRIRESLSEILTFHRDGLKLVLELLNATLPLLCALEQICGDAYSRNARWFETQFTARSAKMYQIRYPFIRHRFNLSASQRKSHVVWVLQNSTRGSDRSNHPSLELRLRNEIYSVQGDGWRGINHGGIASSTSVDRLVFGLHNLVTSYIAQMTPRNPNDRLTESIPNVSHGLEGHSLKTENQSGQDDRFSLASKPAINGANGSPDTNVQSAQQERTTDVDVISID